MIFYWSLNDSRSLQVSGTLLSILIDLNNAVVWMVFACPLISKSSSPFIKLLGIVPSAPVTIGMTFTFMFHSFFSSLLKFTYLSLFSLSLIFTLWSARMAKLVFFCCWLSLGLVVWLRLGDPFISQNPREVCASYSPGIILGCTYTICSYR